VTWPTTVIPRWSLSLQWYKPPLYEPKAWECRLGDRDLTKEENGGGLSPRTMGGSEWRMADSCSCRWDLVSKTNQKGDVKGARWLQKLIAKLIDLLTALVEAATGESNLAVAVLGFCGGCELGWRRRSCDYGKKGGGAPELAYIGAKAWSASQITKKSGLARCFQSGAKSGSYTS
jgi:hypothetical protein